jgi:Sulfotransferase family
MIHRTATMQPEQIPRQRRNATYVIPQWRLVFVSTPKAGCTAIKWMLADLQDVSDQPFYASASSETSRGTTIHQGRKLWGPATPRLRDLSAEQLAEITPDNGWFVFSMTRHPGARLWSAWQSKLLLHEPRFAHTFAAEPWFPCFPRDTDDVVRDWDRFVRAIAAEPKMPIMRDIHFRPQSGLLGIGRAYYDRLYDTSEFATMVDDVRDHLRRQGWDGELKLRRSNETPLPPLERAFPQHVLDTIATLYAPDFRKLDYDGPRPPRLQTGDYSSDLMAATGIIIERGERIGDLSGLARTAHPSRRGQSSSRSIRARARQALGR